MICGFVRSNIEGISMMDEVTRRTLLAATATGGVLAAAGVAGAQTNQSVPQPQRPGHGGTDPGPRNLERERQNPDLLVPPSTDHGTLPNLRYSFADSHVRLDTGGWARQVDRLDQGHQLCGKFIRYLRLCNASYRARNTKVCRVAQLCAAR
jgi:hypothetical protein